MSIADPSSRKHDVDERDDRRDDRRTVVYGLIDLGKKSDREIEELLKMAQSLKLHRMFRTCHEILTQRRLTHPTLSSPPPPPPTTMAPQSKRRSVLFAGERSSGSGTLKVGDIGF